MSLRSTGNNAESREPKTSPGACIQGAFDRLSAATRHFPGLGILAHIMEPWTMAMALGWRAQADVLGQLREGVARHAIRDPAAAFGYKESRTWFRKDAVSPLGVLF